MGVFLNSILENDELLATDIEDINDGDTALDNDINDGIESPVEDPLEEASMIMYESQANFNQIMMAIGMHELNEAANGRVAVFTEADVSGFFAKVKETIKRMYTRIVTAINEFLVEFGAKVNNDSNFFAKYKAEIIEGFNTGNWSLEGYDYSNFAFTDVIKSAEADLGSRALAIAGTKFEDHVGDTASADEVKEYKKELLMDIANKKDDKIKTIADATNALIDKVRGKNPIQLRGKITINDIKRALDGTEYREAKNTIRTIRDSYKRALDRLATLEKNAKKDKNIDKNEKNSGMKNISALSDVLIFERNCINSVYLASLRMTRDRANQARKIAHMCYKLGKNIDNDKRAAHLGESSIFSIELI